LKKLGRAKKNGSHVENQELDKYVKNKKNIFFLKIKRMRHTWKNVLHVKQCGTLGKNAAYFRTLEHLEKCTTLGKMHHTWQNAPHLEKCSRRGKTRLTLKHVGNEPHFGTLKRVRHTWLSAAHLKKFDTLGNISPKHFSKV